MAYKLYHFSKTKIPSGQFLRPTGTHHLPEEIETLLAQTKPKHCIARPECVFVSEEEGCEFHGLPFTEGFLHQVEPVGSIERRDNAWLGVLQLRHSKWPRLKESGEKKYPELSNEQICRNYWNGVASDTPNWEIAAEKIMVNECLDEVPRKLKRNIPLPF